MNTTYTMTRRHDNMVLETGVATYMTAIKNLDNYPNFDVMIHPDGSDWMEIERNAPNNSFQSGFDYL